MKRHFIGFISIAFIGLIGCHSIENETIFARLTLPESPYTDVLEVYLKPNAKQDKNTNLPLELPLLQPVTLQLAWAYCCFGPVYEGDPSKAPPLEKLDYEVGDPSILKLRSFSGNAEFINFKIQTLPRPVNYLWGFELQGLRPGETTLTISLPAEPYPWFGTHVLRVKVAEGTPDLDPQAKRE